VTYRCCDCGQDFYGEEPQNSTIEVVRSYDQIIDDEEALRAAEEELKRQSEEDDDRMCR
jgi:hypothetical protein